MNNEYGMAIAEAIWNDLGENAGAFTLVEPDIRTAVLEKWAGLATTELLSSGWVGAHQDAPSPFFRFEEADIEVIEEMGMDAYSLDDIMVVHPAIVQKANPDGLTDDHGQPLMIERPAIIVVMLGQPNRTIPLKQGIHPQEVITRLEEAKIAWERFKRGA